ncbi:MAG: serine/threonine-protein kinase, partial [Micromonosporaceae bacterium]
MSTEARSGDLVAARYRLESLLGRGGMGRVWRGRDEVLEREVAVKELLVPPGVDGEEADTLTRRMVREAQAAARLVHHAIATVYDVVIHDDRPWIVMQLAPGRALDAIIRADGPLPPVRAAGIALQILGALDVAHNAGVVHRDVKPGNVIVQGGDHSQLGDQAKFDGHIQLEEDAQRDDGASHDSVRPEDRAVLTDFGIAVIEGDPTLTNTGMVLGSPTYLAPERARGDAATPGSDLWSVGATLYAMVEGRPPYQRESSLATLAALVNEPPAPHQQQGLMAAVLDG